MVYFENENQDRSQKNGKIRRVRWRTLIERGLRGGGEGVFVMTTMAIVGQTRVGRGYEQLVQRVNAGQSQKRKRNQSRGSS